MSAPVVVFDLDGTLTLRDTSLPFLRSVAGREAVGKAALLAGLWAASDLAMAAWSEKLGKPPGVGGVSGRWEARLHERVVSRVLVRRPRAELEAAAQAFAERLVPAGLRPDARARVEEHLGKGYRLVLASASLELYLKPVAALLGMDVAVGTRLAFQEGVATGRFEGLPCWGEEKLQRVREALGPDGGEILHAYGDSAGDAAVLAAARHATRVR